MERQVDQACTSWHMHERIWLTLLQSVPTQPQLLAPRRVLQVVLACVMVSKSLQRDMV
jgi:hypothetical protein